MSAFNFSPAWSWVPNGEFEYRKRNPPRGRVEWMYYGSDRPYRCERVDRFFTVSASRKYLPGGYRQRHTLLMKFGRLIKKKAGVIVFTGLLSENIYPLKEFALCPFKTPLHIAIDHGRWDVVSLLVSLGHPILYDTDKSPSPHHVPSPLVYAVSRRKFKIFEVLATKVLAEPLSRTLKNNT